MSDIFLHHYAASPWAEVVRLALGLKGLEWHSVETPSVMPKPRLAVLTGGYARIPVLQIGADIFCDTAAIMEALEAIAPEPTLFAGDGQCALAAQAQGPLFFAAVAAALDGMPMRGMEAFWADREKRFGMQPDGFKAMTPGMTAMFGAHLDSLDQRLGDGRAFLCGDTVGHGDLAHYQLLWFQDVQGPGGVARHMGGRPHLAGWARRVAAIGHGVRRESDADAAIAAASAVQPAPLTGFAAAEGFSAGQRVLVSQEGTTDAAVEGTLALLNGTRIVLRRIDPEAAEVAVHFPRAGQILRAA